MGLPNPHLTTRKLSRSEKVEEGKEEQGFKDAHYSPSQLSSSEAVFSHTHLGKSESRTSPYPTSLALPLAASPVRPPPPYYSIALGAKTDSSQELLQSAFLRLSWLLQPVSWLCSLRLCLGQSPFPLPPRPRLTQPLIQSLEVGRHHGHRLGAPAKSTDTSSLEVPRLCGQWVGDARQRLGGQAQRSTLAGAGADQGGYLNRGQELKPGS